MPTLPTERKTLLLERSQRPMAGSSFAPVTAPSASFAVVTAPFVSFGVVTASSISANVVTPPDCTLTALAAVVALTALAALAAFKAYGALRICWRGAIGLFVPTLISRKRVAP